jgi:endonuclease III
MPDPPRRGRPRADHAGQVEQRILDAAAATFLTQGFGRTTLDHIAEVAHVSKTTLYGRFPTKEVLFAAMVSAAVQTFQSRMALTPTAGTLKERLIQMGIELAEATLTPESIALMRVTSAEADAFPEVARQGFRIGFDACVRCIAECLAVTASDGAEASLLPEKIATVTPMAARFVEMALHPLYMHAFFGADLAHLRHRAVRDVAAVAEILLATELSDTEIQDDRTSEDKTMMKQKRIAEIYRILSENYVTFEETEDPWITNGLSSTPFRALVSGCLSTVTVTSRVVKACIPLYQRVSNFEELLALDDEELRSMIKPVAHYNRKTEYLKTLCRQIINEHGGQIPNNREDLLKLQGVGRKVADLMMNFIFSEDTVAVDTHILRLLNRLGIVTTDSAEVAANVIDAATPKIYKRHAHEWLIQHGMKVCTARTPKCQGCVLVDQCSYDQKNL